MARKNGILKAVTTPTQRGVYVDDERRFNTVGLRVAHENPTPRDPDIEWLCRDVTDPEVFHPTDEATLAEAQALCAACPAREICLDLGVARKEWGVWGGVLLERGKPLATPRAPGRPRKATAPAVEAVALA